VATGGGAFMSEDTRKEVADKGLSIWLKADFSVLMERVRRKSHRPLLQDADPEGVMKRLLSEREPYYAQADLVVSSRDVAHDVVVAETIAALDEFLSNEESAS